MPRLAITVTSALASMLAVTADVRPAEACSVVRTYLPPSNFELVATTPRIVVARAVDEVSAPGSSTGARIGLEVTSVIRGGGIAAGDRIEVRGSTQHYRGPSQPDDFSRARPGAYSGACTAWDYAIGKHYVLFLDQYGGTWDTRGMPFARVNEEVDPAGGPWLVAVTEYARIAAIPALADRRKALDALVARGSRKGAGATERAIAGDVAAHLVQPSPFKSFAELEALYKAAAAADRPRIVIAIGTGADPAAAAFMIDLVARLRAGNPPVPSAVALAAVGPYYEKVADPAALTELGEVYIGLGSRAKQERWPVMWLLIRRAGASHQALMERVLGSADDEEAGRLAAWFVSHPSAAARRDLQRRVGTRYRDRSEMALGLAGMGDPAVLAWAKRELGRKGDDRWIALYAIARSPLPEADALAGGIIRRGGDDIVVLIQGYAEARHLRAGRRLAELGARTDLPPETRKWLDRTLDERKPSP